MNPQPVFLYNRYMSGVDLTDQFYSSTVFCIKVSNGQRNSLCIA